MTCFVNNVDAIANFLRAYYTKHVVIVIDVDYMTPMLLYPRPRGRGFLVIIYPRDND